MQRPERVILIGVSALACGISSRWLGGNYKAHWPGTSLPLFETISIFTIPLIIMAFLANATALGRLRDAKKALEEQDRKKAALGNSIHPADTARSAEPKKSSVPGAPLLLLIFFSFGLHAGAQAGHAPVFQPAPAAASTPHASASTPAHSPREPQDTFPVPPRSRDFLFYLQRTPNTNTIVCELNEKNGTLDSEDPVHVSWIRYTERNQREELSFLQRHFAYGIKSRPVGNDKYELHFISYKKLLLYLAKSPVDNKRHVYAKIVGKEAILNRIFIKINPGGSFWSPNIEYLELTGIDPADGKKLMQRIKI